VWLQYLLLKNEERFSRSAFLLLTTRAQDKTHALGKRINNVYFNAENRFGNGSKPGLRPGYGAAIGG
jgi:hypothetical protein